MDALNYAPLATHITLVPLTSHLTFWPPAPAGERAARAGRARGADWEGGCGSISGGGPASAAPGQEAVLGKEAEQQERRLQVRIGHGA